MSSLWISYSSRSGMALDKRLAASPLLLDLVVGKPLQRQRPRHRQFGGLRREVAHAAAVPPAALRRRRRYYKAVKLGGRAAADGGVFGSRLVVDGGTGGGRKWRVVVGAGLAVLAVGGGSGAGAAVADVTCATAAASNDAHASSRGALDIFTYLQLYEHRNDGSDYFRISERPADTDKADVTDWLR